VAVLSPTPSAPASASASEPSQGVSLVAQVALPNTARVSVALPSPRNVTLKVVVPVATPPSNVHPFETRYRVGA
jgi:hypothetical protein